MKKKHTNFFICRITSTSRARADRKRDMRSFIDGGKEGKAANTHKFMSNNNNKPLTLYFERESDYASHNQFRVRNLSRSNGVCVIINKNLRTESHAITAPCVMSLYISYKAIKML